MQLTQEMTHEVRAVEELVHEKTENQLRRSDQIGATAKDSSSLDRLRDEVMTVLSLATHCEEEIAFLDLPGINCRALESASGWAAACHEVRLQPLPHKRYFDASHHSSTAGRRPTASLSPESSGMAAPP